MMNYIEQRSEEEICAVAAVAHDIWQEYWPSLIGQKQTDYMLDRFLTTEAIATDIDAHGYHYQLVYSDDGELLGFIAFARETMDGSEQDERISHSRVVDERWPDRLFISKIYLYADQRGKHYASRILDYLEDYCAEQGIPAMYLTVNRENVLGIRAYNGRGFDTVDEVDADIGGGFLMTDYIMAKTIRR